MKFCNASLEYAYTCGDTILVEANNEREITSKIHSYNKSHRLNFKIRQKRLILTNPETLESRRVWEIAIIGAENHPDKPVKKRGRPRK